MISALILAGGQGSRMDSQDKGLVHWQGKPLIKHVLNRIDPQVHQVIISANRNLDEYKNFGVPVFSDLPAYVNQGPLAALMSVPIHTQWVVCVPCDTPLLPSNLVAKFQAAQKDAPETLAFYVETSAGLQPSCMYLHQSIIKEIKAVFIQGERSLKGCLKAINAKPVWFELAKDFTNCNTFADLNKLDSRIL